MQLKVFFLVFLLQACGIFGAQHDVLDLTKQLASSRSPENMGRGSGGAVFASGMVFEQLPLSLILRDVSASEVRYGGEVVYVLAIKNTGSKAVAFPWSGEPDSGAKPRLIDLSVLLTLVWTGNGQEVDLHTRSIWGSKEVENTIKVLEPGHEVFIRCKGPITMMGSDAAAALVKSLPQRGMLKAKLQFAKGAPVQAALSSTSENSVPFLMRPATWDAK